MTTRRTVRWAAAVVAALLLAAILWSAYQAYRVEHDLSAATGDAATLKDALVNGDSSSATSSLASLRSHVDDADDRTSGHTWGALTHLPVLGDDADGVQLVSGVLANITGQGLTPLTTSATDLKAFLPKDGRIPVDQLQQLQKPVANADEAFARADQQLAHQNASGFVGPLQSKYRDLAQQVSDAGKALSSADTALKVMPSMLGADGPRNYLLVFQNNAEIRATGGLPGAVALLHADDGKLTLTQQVSGQSFGQTPAPVLPIAPAERKVYGPQFGTYFLDANFTPDFPRAAQLWRADWEQKYGGHIDGVVSLDPVTLSYLLQATGPVTADGTTLTADNTVDQLLHESYIDFPDPARQDQHFQALASAIFAKVTSGANQARPLLQALQQAADDGRLYVHSFEAAENKVIATTELEGALSNDPKAAPSVDVTFNDTTGSKMSYYLRYTTKVISTSCNGGVQTLSGTAHLESVAPQDAATSLPSYVTGGSAYGIPAGTQLVTVRLFSPVSGSISGLVMDGKPVTHAQVASLNGRQVLTTYALLSPQKTSDIKWSMATGSQQIGNVRVSVTPGVSTDQLNSVVPSACG